MPDEYVDMIFTDPPYFLSNDGISCSGGKKVSVNKGEWDRGTNFDEKHEFNRNWLRLAKKILKPNGTIWISGTLHNIFSVGVALEQESYKILNNITWQKTNPLPNLSCRYFTHSTETILWARKIMNLKFDETLAENYKSISQKIRVMSEFWLIENLFCPCCGNLNIEKIKNNSPVADIFCGNCKEIFELKSKKNNIGSKIVDGAYHTMIERININKNPQLFVMDYSADFFVKDLIFIPKFFFTSDIIEKRKPLSENARRAGWTGCNILYEKIPEQGKIDIIRNGEEIELEKILNSYSQTKKLHTENLNLRGWLLDVLNCVNKIKSETFTLQDVYKFADFLKEKHSENKNIEAKIRQQLQFLHDKGFIEFIGNGNYRKLI